MKKKLLTSPEEFERLRYPEPRNYLEELSFANEREPLSYPCIAVTHTRYLSDRGNCTEATMSFVYPNDFNTTSL